jgi:hypothetical protein
MDVRNKDTIYTANVQLRCIPFLYKLASYYLHPSRCTHFYVFFVLLFRSLSPVFYFMLYTIEHNDKQSKVHYPVVEHFVTSERIKSWSSLSKFGK